MVSVGYMDPGNWATDLAGGAKFGYTLPLGNHSIEDLMAILLRHLQRGSGSSPGAIWLKPAGIIFPRQLPLCSGLLAKPR